MTPTGRGAPSPPELHHIGFVVPSLKEAADRFLLSLPLQWDRQVYFDPAQTVAVTFLSHAAPAPLIELVEPAGSESLVSAFLGRGGGLHHLCYEVDSVSDELGAVLQTEAILLLEPRPAVAFGGREIAWVCTRDRLLIEYLQREPRSAAP